MLDQIVDLHDEVLGDGQASQRITIRAFDLTAFI